MKGPSPVRRDPATQLVASPFHVVPWVLAFLAAVALGGCGHSHSDSSSTESSIVIEEERNWFTGQSDYDWDSPGGVARVTLEIDDFNHGDLLVRIFDARGERIYSKFFLSNDWYWYINGEYVDIDFTEDGAAGIWTIILDYDEFTGEVKLTVESLEDPDPPDGVPPPTDTSELLDASYGTDGRAAYSPDTTVGKRVAIDSTGRSLVVGTLLNRAGLRRLAVWRYGAGGSIDATFGTDGLSTFDDAVSSAGFDVAVDSSDRVLVSGYRSEDGDTTDALLLRLDTSGDLDGSFGTGGVVTLDEGDDEIGAAVATDGDGNVLLAGSSQDPDTDDGFAFVARYNSSGAPTPAFGAGGVARTTNRADRAWDLVVDGASRPLLAGLRREQGAAFWRFTSAGAADGTFGTAGVATSVGDAGELRLARSLTLAADGTFAATGVRVFDSGTDPVEMVIWRYDAGGLPVTTFNGTGFLAYRFADGWAGGADIVYDAAARLLILGVTRTVGDGDMTDASATLWRYFGGGAIDTTLPGSSNSGVARFDERSGNVGTGGSALTVLGDGKVIATGGGADRETGARDLIIWKLDP